MANITLDARQQQKHDTSTNFNNANKLYLEGEFLVETDTGKVKIGDGTLGYKSLPYTIGTRVPEGAKFTDTTYTAGTGLSLNGTSFSISNSGVTAGSYGPSQDSSVGFGDSIDVPYISVNSRGQITSADSRSITLPAEPTPASIGAANKIHTHSPAAIGAATAEQGIKADAALPKSGGTMTGFITLHAAPTANMHPATKKYVDDKWKDLPQGGVQSDWNQNDSAELDFIKNRPFYTETNETVFLPSGQYTIVTAQTRANVAAVEAIIANFTSAPTDGQQCRITFDSNTYTETAIDSRGEITLGYSNYDGTKPYFVFYEEADGSNVILCGVPESDVGVHTIEIVGIQQTIHKIPEQYLPKAQVTQSDFAEIYTESPSFISRRPFYKTAYPEATPVFSDDMVKTTCFSGDVEFMDMSNPDYPVQVAFYPLIPGQTYKVTVTGIDDPTVQKTYSLTDNEATGYERVQLIDSSQEIGILQSYEQFEGLTLLIGTMALPYGKYHVEIYGYTYVTRFLSPDYLPKSAQPDWNETDELTFSHIKNRPFYHYESNFEKFIDNIVKLSSVGSTAKLTSILFDGRSPAPIIGELYQVSVKPLNSSLSFYNLRFVNDSEGNPYCEVTDSTANSGDSNRWKITYKRYEESYYIEYTGGPGASQMMVSISGAINYNFKIDPSYLFPPILSSPDGSQFRLTVANDGTLSAVAIGK